MRRAERVAARKALVPSTPSPASDASPADTEQRKERHGKERIERKAWPRGTQGQHRRGAPTAPRRAWDRGVPVTAWLVAKTKPEVNVPRGLRKCGVRRMQTWERPALRLDHPFRSVLKPVEGV